MLGASPKQGSDCSHSLASAPPEAPLGWDPCSSGRNRLDLCNCCVQPLEERLWIISITVRAREDEVKEADVMKSGGKEKKKRGLMILWFQSGNWFLFLTIAGAPVVECTPPPSLRKT
jgi:hypothetical protein